MVTCPSCGEENPAKFRLCGYCGTPLVKAPPPREVRRTVTIVFTDLTGSTDMGERLDTEALREVISRYFDTMQAVLQEHGGTVEKFIGDAVMAVFGLPRVQEDDAIRAVRAAAAMQEALAALNEDLERQFGVRLRGRTGVNTGEVVSGDPSAGQRLVTGDPVNVAARLEQTAGPGEVLIGELTRVLVRDVVDLEPVAPLTLKGKAEPVPAWRLLGVRADAEAQTHDTSLFGRDDELATLRGVFDGAVTAGRCRTAVVLGPPGIGKSRLVAELGGELASRGARVLTGRCLPYGRGITFWPIAEVARGAAGITESDTAGEVRGKLLAVVDDEAVTDRVMAAMGLDMGAQLPLEELFWGARRLLETLAADRPLAVVIEDLQWAAPSLLDLLRNIAASSSVPLVFVCPARDTLLDRPDWEDPEGTTHLVLTPLAAGAVEQVLDAALGAGALAAPVRDRIREAADGNPLFVRQLLSMLVDQGLIARDEDGWRLTGELSELDVPPTVRAILAARLDRLSQSERSLLEAASVVGLEVPRQALEALAPEFPRAEADEHLATLVRRGFIRRDDVEGDGSFTGFTFQHGSIRDAAYGVLLKRDRSVLHERFARWAQDGWAGRSRGGELDEIIGYHLEQAHAYLAQLGPIDDHGRDLATRAAGRLGAAGRRAFGRSDMPAAANLLRRTAGLLEPEDPERLALLPELGEALVDIGEFPWAEVFVEEAVEGARKLGDDALQAHARIVRLHAKRHSADPTDWDDEAVAAAQAALPVFERAGDDGGLAATYRLLAMAHGTACRYGEAATAAERAMEHARAAGDVRQRRWAASQYAISASYGPIPVDEAMPRCEAIITESSGDRRTEGLTMSVLARLTAMRGDFDRARELSASARATLAELGRSVVAASTSLDSSGVHLLAGDAAEAERDLRRDFDALTAMGETYLLSSVAAELARAVLLQGRDDEARALTHTAEELAAEDDVDSQALWRSTRAKLLARRGDHDAAVPLALRAVDLLRSTDASVTLADALIDAATVLADAGRHAEARAFLEDAHTLLERKGNTVAADRAQELLRASATTIG